ncbi:RNA polymerase II C-terminal domain phosphatase-like 1 isoform X2 [Hordeum vulgare subsp. vulgare]|uniref:RNA polymerase II C-terminal domain phosphatase-like 1 isoform X2 n=1 Tax=Hordeum vulgare subsp. vulgare TaxID=112509 RepID=UPI001D1A5685|nr:RNA polymerase II C-terminal domain phosphatase-like 1 isoform X2 [Hordeum vulgare subsp. vulgare]
MIKSTVYFGHISIGEVELWPKGETNVAAAPWVREIRVDRLSPPSERCLPLAVLHTVSSTALCFVMESRPSPTTADGEPPSSLVAMHTACLRDNKTAVFPLGIEEIHLVAMKPKSNLPNHACFWGYKVPLGLYNSCLSMLNLRCLGIVFDLDETLIVANTTRSFEDRIDALQRKLSKEIDPQRISGMLAEIKRYQEDRSMLKQYIDGDQVNDGGKVYKVQSEVVPPLSDNHQPMIRPVIRLQERSIILTRINPSIRDTSVLVRLRPAWDDLRSYLIARGRKRFEVYVCTMAERDYALEMWRLLDPDSRLINSVQLPHRLVCVKSGSKKSLLNVFHDGSCHPGMALVIDDRLKVWDEKDQCRVHVVPAFSPYYAPQAEANFPIPVLCVARNVACNVRGSFFKEFDEGLLPSISDVHFDDELNHVPSSPDVGNYLISEDENAASLNVNKDPLAFDGMADAEVERRMKEAVCSVQAADPVTTDVDVMPVAANQQLATSSFIPLAPPLGMVPLNNDQGPQPPSISWPDAQAGLVDPSQGSPAREEGEVPESELDPDTRRRLLILQHGQDTRDPTPPFAAEPSVQVSVPPVQSQGNWFPVEDEMDPRNLNRTSTDFHLESDAVPSDKSHPPHQPYFPAHDNPVFSDRFNHQNQRYSSQLPHSEDRRMLQNQAPTTYRSFSGEDMATQRFHSGHRSSQMEPGRQLQYTETSGAVLEEIAAKCGFKVEYRSTLCDTTELRFSIQIWIVGEKVGEGMGRTRKEAQYQAANISLRNLADRFLSFDPDKMAVSKDDGFSSNPNKFKYTGNDGDDIVPVASTSDGSRYMHERVDNSTKSAGSVAALKELCTAEGYNLVFQVQPSPLDSLTRKEIHAQIEIGGQILGKGVGATWEEAKAADGALGTLRYMLGQRPQKRSGSPRSFGSNYNKRYKPDFQPLVQRFPSGRYSRNDSRVP